MSDPADFLHGRILKLRGHRVILDSDLARLYGVTTMRFNEAFKRNAARFPADFAFQLSREELANLISRIAISSSEANEGERNRDMWSQSVTTSNRRAHGGRRKLPWVFTEHGAVMAANTLRSPRAIEMSVYVVRAFIKQREALAANATILRRLAEIDKTLIEHDSALQILWKKLQPLLAPPPDPPKRRIGFTQ